MKALLLTARLAFGIRPFWAEELAGQQGIDVFGSLALRFKW